jgi:hypothetical protein
METFITLTVDTSQIEKKIGKFIASMPMVMKKTVNDIMDYVETQAFQFRPKSRMWTWC